jgi:hypothetical protein
LNDEGGTTKLLFEMFFTLYFIAPAQTNKQTNPQTDSYKYLAWRKARSRFESAAPSGDEACQIGIENLQTPKPQPRPHTLPGQSQNINFFTSEPQFSDFFKFLVHFFLSQKTSKFQLRPKRLKISKI